MLSCRCCGSQELKDLGWVGEVAPFFLKRVFNLEVRAAQARHPLRVLAQRMLAVPQMFFSRVYGESAYVEMQMCRACDFVQTKHRFPDEALGALYADYRSESYNRERSHYEPSYAKIASQVGAGEAEVQARVRSLTEWLADKVDPVDGFEMLDYGGADGRFLPKLRGQKYVFEISDTLPLDGVTRIASEAELGLYSYVQIAHVLEHVAKPLELLKHVAGFVKPGGYLYVEVPQDLTDAEFDALSGGKLGRALTVHEHINFFCASSLSRLVEVSGLKVVRVEKARLDLGWIAANNLRALCRAE